MGQKDLYGNWAKESALEVQVRLNKSMLKHDLDAAQDMMIEFVRQMRMQGMENITPESFAKLLDARFNKPRAISKMMSDSEAEFLGTLEAIQQHWKVLTDIWDSIPRVANRHLKKAARIIRTTLNTALRATAKIAVEVGKAIIDLAENAIRILITAVFAAAASYREFNRELYNTLAVLGDVESNLAGFTDQSVNLSRENYSSATMVARALYEIASAGYGAADAMEYIGPITKLSTAHQYDLFDATKLVITTLKAYRKHNLDVTYTTDVFSKAVSKSQATLKKLQYSLAYVTPYAAALNIELKDLVTVLMAGYDAGLEGSRAGTGLRAALVKLMHPTKAQAKLWAEMFPAIKESNEEITKASASYFEASIRSRGFLNVLDEISSKLTSVAEVSQQFTVRSLPLIAAIVDIGQGEFADLAAPFNELDKSMKETNSTVQQYAKLMGDVHGATDKMVEIQKQSFVMWHRIAMNTLDTVGIRMFEVLGPFMTRVLQDFTDVLISMDPIWVKLRKGVEENQEAFDTLRVAIKRLMKGAIDKFAEKAQRLNVYVKALAGALNFLANAFEKKDWASIVENALYKPVARVLSRLAELIKSFGMVNLAGIIKRLSSGLSGATGMPSWFEYIKNGLKLMVVWVDAGIGAFDLLVEKMRQFGVTTKFIVGSYVALGAYYDLERKVIAPLNLERKVKGWVGVGTALSVTGAALYKLQAILRKTTPSGKLSYGKYILKHADKIQKSYAGMTFVSFVEWHRLMIASIHNIFSMLGGGLVHVGLTAFGAALQELGASKDIVGSLFKMGTGFQSWALDFGHHMTVAGGTVTAAITGPLGGLAAVLTGIGTSALKAAAGMYDFAGATALFVAPKIIGKMQGMGVISNLFNAMLVGGGIGVSGTANVLTLFFSNVTAAAQTFLAFFSKAWVQVAGIFALVVLFVMKVLGNVQNSLDVLRKAFGDLLSVAKAVINDVIQSGAWKELKRTLSDLFGIVSTGDGALNDMVSIIVLIISVVLKFITALLPAVGPIMKFIIGVTTFFVRLGTVVNQTGMWFVGGIRIILNLIKQAILLVGHFFEYVGTSLGGFIGFLADVVSGIMQILNIIPDQFIADDAMKSLNDEMDSSYKKTLRVYDLMGKLKTTPGGLYPITEEEVARIEGSRLRHSGRLNDWKRAGPAGIEAFNKNIIFEHIDGVNDIDEILEAVWKDDKRDMDNLNINMNAGAS